MPDFWKVTYQSFKPSYFTVIIPYLQSFERIIYHQPKTVWQQKLFEYFVAWKLHDRQITSSKLEISLSKLIVFAKVCKNFTILFQGYCSFWGQNFRLTWNTCQRYSPWTFHWFLQQTGHRETLEHEQELLHNLVLLFYHNLSDKYFRYL